MSTPATPTRSLNISFSRIIATASSAKVPVRLFRRPCVLASTATALGSTALTMPHVLDGGDLLDLLQHVGKAGEHEDGVTLDRHHDGGVDDAVMVGPAGQIGDVGRLTPLVLEPLGE